jgi:UDPglucose 6-dehydrogenase
MDGARQDGPDGVVYCEDEYDAATGTDAVVLATEWNQFRGLDVERLKTLMRAPVLFDLRNVYEPAAMRERGVRYDSVGRP